MRTVLMVRATVGARFFLVEALTGVEGTKQSGRIHRFLAEQQMGFGRCSTAGPVQGGRTRAMSGQ
jgi:hypothetical protein